jgi:DNA-binding MarR family transcriptional regulator
MAILREIYSLSNNTKYNGWCIKSKTNIADTLDLSKGTVLNGIEKLINMGYVERNEQNKYLRPTDSIRELEQEKDSFLLAFKSKNMEFISGKVEEILSGNNLKNIKNERSEDEQSVQNLAEIGTKNVPPVQKLTAQIGTKIVPPVQNLAEIGTKFGRGGTKFVPKIYNNTTLDQHKGIPEPDQTKQPNPHPTHQEHGGGDADGFKRCIGIYNSFCKSKTGMGAKIDASDGKALKSILTYLKGAEAVKRGDSTIEGEFEAILSQWSVLEAFLQDKIRLRQINSNLPTILAQIKKSKEMAYPTIDEFLLYVEQNSPNFSEIKESAKQKYDVWVKSGWIDGYGNKIKDWKSKTISVLSFLKKNNNEQTKSRFKVI